MIIFRNPGLIPLDANRCCRCGLDAYGLIVLFEEPGTDD